MFRDLSRGLDLKDLAVQSLSDQMEFPQTLHTFAISPTVVTFLGCLTG